MAKKVQAYVKLQVAAGMANPSPPVGPALGQQGVNIMDSAKRSTLKLIPWRKVCRSRLLSPFTLTVPLPLLPRLRRLLFC